MSSSGGTQAVDVWMVEDATRRRSLDAGRDRWFQMPLHYPRFKRTDYEAMPEWKLDLLLREYGLSFNGDLRQKRKFAAETFLWPDEH